MAFTVPEYCEPKAVRYWQDESGQKWRSLGNIYWFTNIDTEKRHESMILYKKYDPDAHELWLYSKSITDWTQAIFPMYRKEMKGLQRGLLYNRFKDALVESNRTGNQGQRPHYG